MQNNDNLTNTSAVPKNRSKEDIAARIFVGVIWGLFAAGGWFGLTIGIFVSPDSSLWLKVPMIALFIVGLVLIEFFLIRAIVKSKKEWKFDKKPRRNQFPNNRIQTSPVKRSNPTSFDKTTWYDDPGYSSVAGNRYHNSSRR